MDIEKQEVKATVTRTPAEMLALQVELLEAIRESLDNQQRIVMRLAQQQKTQAEQLTNLSDALLPDVERNPGHQWVKVQDVNVPFVNLSMFLVKLSLAAVPAAIVVAVLWLLAAAFLGIVGSALF